MGGLGGVVVGGLGSVVVGGFGSVVEHCRDSCRQRYCAGGGADGGGGGGVVRGEPGTLIAC